MCGEQTQVAIGEAGLHVRRAWWQRSTARTKLVTVRVVRNGQILGYTLQGSWLDLLTELDEEQSGEKWGEGSDRYNVWREMRKCIGEAWFGQKRARLSS